jgi:hypothetical protein
LFSVGIRGNVMLTAKIFNISKSVLALLTIAIVVLVAVFLSSLYWSHDKQKSDIIKKSHNQFETLYVSSLEKETLTVTGLLKSVSRIENFQLLFKERNRKGLIAATKTLNTTLQADLKITHFYFHTNDGTNFLRVHNQSRYGDTITRKTMQLAMETKLTASGLELGPLGTLTLRVVYPWIVNNALIGFIEMGKELDVIISPMKESMGIKLVSFIDKQYLEKEAWIEGMKMLGRTPKWDHFHNYVLSSSDLEEQLPTEIHNILSDGAKRNIAQDEHSTDSLNHNSHNHFIKFKLIDIQGRHVGQVIGILDTSALRASTKLHLLVVVGACIFVGGFLMVFFYFFLKKTETNLQQTHLKLQQTQKKLTEQKILESTNKAFFQETIRKLVELAATLEDDARQVVDPGTICFWVEGSSIAIPYGPTPISEGDECRLATAVNTVGMCDGDPQVLKSIKDGDRILVVAG